MIFIDSETKDADMIFADPTEAKALDPLADFKVTYVNELEELTGADMIISVEAFPMAPAFIPMHIQAGACLVQRKKGHDLASSIGERMATSLAKMKACGARQAQCVLLFVGEMKCDRDANAIIDGVKTELLGERSYWSILGSMSKWNERGGVIEQISRPALLPGWCSIKEHHLTEFHHSPVHTVYPSPPDMWDPPTKDDPLQELILVKDWRRTLLTFPSIGPKRLEAFIQHMRDKGMSMNLLQALLTLTDYDEGTKVPGFGRGIVKQARDWLGFDEDWYQLSVQIDEAALEVAEKKKEKLNDK